MRIGIYKDTFANNRGADIAVMIPLNEICAKFPLLTNVVDFRVGGQKSVYRATSTTLRLGMFGIFNK